MRERGSDLVLRRQRVRGGEAQVGAAVAQRERRGSPSPLVTCRQAAMRTPSNGRSVAKRSRMPRITGISRAAHSMRRTPACARDASAMSDATAPPASRVDVVMKQLLEGGSTDQRRSYPTCRYESRESARASGHGPSGRVLLGAFRRLAPCARAAQPRADAEEAAPVEVRLDDRRASSVAEALVGVYRRRVRGVGG